MYCAYCGNVISKEKQKEVIEMKGVGKEVKTNKSFTFSFILCSECNARIDSNLSGGEERALRREYEMSLLDQLLTHEEIEKKLKEFDTKTFGGPNLDGVFGR